MRFKLNGVETIFDGDPDFKLLDYLRTIEGMSVSRDGCDGMNRCGICTVKIDERAVLSCLTPMKKVMDKSVVTADKSDQRIQHVFSYALQKAGTADCSQCVPEVVMRSRILLKNNSNPTYGEALRVAKINLCRCIGRHKIARAVLEASEILNDESRMMQYKISDEIREG